MATLQTPAQAATHSTPVEQSPGNQNLGNMENYFSYTPMQFEIGSHILTLGFGVFAAALAYFILTTKSVAPKYRLGNALSAVVAISALLILAREAFLWTQIFTLNEATGQYVRKDGELFNNGYRYMNWSIDVPVLLVQLLVVTPIAMKKRINYGVQFVIGGLIMVWASWWAQFYEQGNQVEGVSIAQFWGGYIVGWIGYVWILAVVFKVVADCKREWGPRSPFQKWMNAIATLLAISWTGYAFAILQPIFWWSPASGVTRQIVFTLCDISSKAIYGVMLGMLASQLSKAEGYDTNISWEIWKNDAKRFNRAAEHVSNETPRGSSPEFSKGADA